MATIPRVQEALARVARSVLGACVGAVGAVAMDASWARAVAGAGQGGIAIHLADAGLLAPVAMGVGVGVGLAGLFLNPHTPSSPAQLIAALRMRAVGRPADVAALVPLVVLGIFFWMTAAAHLARAILGIDVRPALVGVALAAATLVLGLLVGLLVLAMTPPLRRTLATASESHPGCVDPAFTGGAAMLAVGVLFGVGVATGSVSGDGGFWGIWGIFKRHELDLRAPALLLWMAFAGVAAPVVLRRVRGALALAVGLLPIVLTVRAAGALNVAPGVAQAIERGAPLGKPLLFALRRLVDRDQDGFSPFFAGGDCDDRNPAINPGAEESHDNGIDEDCSGADLHLVPIKKPSKPALAASVSVGVPAGKSAIPSDLNLIVVTIDTMRAELHYAGNPHELSPNIDKLAETSVVFDRAYALASYTGKSVGPMLIGKYGSETHRNWGHSNAFTREDTTLAQRLQKVGLHTMSVQALRYFGVQSGLNRGFDVLDMSATGDGTIKEMENSVTGDKVSDAALKLLSKPEHTDKRFFMWIHYLDPHADYLPHKELPSFGTSQRDQYDGEIAFVDKHLGRVLDAVAAAPWGKKTAIVVTSDHGEAFGEHKMWRHGFELWEELIRVPLIIHVPGIAPGHVTARRSAIDLVPTLLELMGGGVAPSSKETNDFVSGVSMVPELLAPATAEPRDVLIDMPDGPFNDPRRALIHGDLKLIVSNGVQRELYDLAKDPDERQNLWEQGGAEANEIGELYAAARARMREIKVTGEKK